MSRAFSEWLNSFRESMASYDYYIDFNKVYRNVEGIKIELSMLNSLIGSKNIKKDFQELVRKYPEVLKCIPLLLAVRNEEIFCQDATGGYLYRFGCADGTPADELVERYTYFMERTGLFELLQDHIISNVMDYATGVETGLDSNGRKNRGGHLMEDCGAIHAAVWFHTAWLKGRASASAPSAMAARKEMTGQVTGEKRRRRMSPCLAHPVRQGKPERKRFTAAYVSATRGQSS